MPSPEQILTSIRNSIGGSSVTELLAIYPQLSRRTMQRRLRELIDAKSVKANGQGTNGGAICPFDVTSLGSVNNPRTDRILECARS